MASSLKLMLERHISANRVSSALELPLDRKLGELSRLTYVYANSLPLRLERRISEQPQANALYLALSQPLGTLAPPTFVTADRLPLPLDVPIAEQPPSDRLPLGLTRKLGTLVGAPVAPPVEGGRTGLTIEASWDIEASASLDLHYDANVFRGLMRDTQSDLQSSKLTGINAQSGFENDALLSQKTASDYQQSRLIGADKSAQFEADEVLQSASQVSFEQSKIVGTNNQNLFESMTRISQAASVKAETAKLVGQTDWLSFEAMARRQIERALHGENSRLIGDWLHGRHEGAIYARRNWSSLSEAARLLFWKRPCNLPPIWQTVVLPKQHEPQPKADRLPLTMMRKWRETRRYVYSNSLPMPLERKISERASSDRLAISLDMPRGVLVRHHGSARLAMPLRERKRYAPNVVDDITLYPADCTKKPRTRITVDATNYFSASALLLLKVLQNENSDYSKGFIFVTNSVNLKRTDDGRNITLLSFSVGIDSNSYCWSFSASVPIGELSKVNTAIESRIGVDLTVNGHLWRFILDGCEDSAAFGERSLTIKGKSRAMLLAHPYAKHRGYKYDTAMTARQIAEDELNRNAVPSGFSLDWDLVGVNGWNIPANTYSYSGRTPINSLQWIAEAAGGFINSDMAADILHVKALYPVKSWEWYLQTPELVLPQSLILNRTRSRVTKPNYNGVNVWGERDGSVGALIKRTGTSGGYQPPMITSDLITDYDVATARGIAVLSDVGEIGNIGITMPMHADFGVLKPATLIGVNDGESWIGMVRGTSISGKLGSNRALEIEQTVDIERHFDKEGG